MTRTAWTVFFGMTIAATPVAAQDVPRPRPWEPGFVELSTALPKAMPKAKAPESATKISPFADKFQASQAEFQRLGFATRGLSLTAPAMNAAALPKSRAIVLGWAKSFPALGDDFEVLAPETAPVKDCIALAGKDHEVPGTYNCIAYTAGIKNMWVNPYQSVAQWNLFYNPLGYTLPATIDTRFVPGHQKVAVYGMLTPEGLVKEFTHAALQNDDGTWSSKLGSGPLVRHRTAESVCGPVYGQVVMLYARKK